MNTDDKDIVIEARALLSDPQMEPFLFGVTRDVLRALADEVEALRGRFSVTCNNCGERYLGPRDDTLHGYNICNMSRCED